MIQVSESRVGQLLDEMAADSGGQPDIDRDMALGAVHFAYMLALIDVAEFRRRCDALTEVDDGDEQ